MKLTPLLAHAIIRTMNSEEKTILIIDDEEDFSFFVGRNLERIKNYIVISANSGESGINLAQEKKPNLILLDIMMPGIDGFEVLKRLKADDLTSLIPVIMLTGKDDQASRLRAAKLKNADYLIKPIQVEELRAKIEKALK